ERDFERLRDGGDHDGVPVLAAVIMSAWLPAATAIRWLRVRAQGRADSDNRVTTFMSGNSDAKSGSHSFHNLRNLVRSVLDCRRLTWTFCPLLRNATCVPPGS